MRIVYALAIEVLVCSSLSLGQLERQAMPVQPPLEIPTVELQLSSQRQLTMPDIDWFDEPQCDAKGNAYVHAAANFNDGLVVRLDFSKDDAVIYRWHYKPTEMPFMGFSVTPAGDVWMLGVTKDALSVVSFGSDGSEGSQTHVDLAPQFWPQRFTVFPDGAFLLSGFFGEDAPDKLEGTFFTGIFDASGKLRHRLPDKTAKVLPKDARLAHKEAFSTIGPDGNVYVLRATKVEVITPMGELTREIPFSKPDPKAVTERVWVVANRIAVMFLSKRTDGRNEPLFLVVDSTTGLPVGRYRSFLGYPLCFTGDSIIFQRSQQGRIVVNKADLR